MESYSGFEDLRSEDTRAQSGSLPVHLLYLLHLLCWAPGAPRRPVVQKIDKTLSTGAFKTDCAQNITRAKPGQPALKAVDLLVVVGGAANLGSDPLY